MHTKTDWDPKIRIPVKKVKGIHDKLLPKSLRCGIIGPSGCGKTTLMIDNYILCPGWLNWNKINHLYIYIYSKSLDQPQYQYLIEKCKNIDEVTFISNQEDIIPLDECEDKSVVVFDDFILENQDVVRKYFTLGRHKKIDCWYLAQTYSKIPKQLVRDNLNFLNIFRQDDTNLNHIYHEFVGGNMKFNDFKELCRKCWTEEFGFLTIDMTRKSNDGKYRNKIKTFFKNRLNRLSRLNGLINSYINARKI
jgi:hypothetical protein